MSPKRDWSSRRDKGGFDFHVGTHTGFFLVGQMTGVLQACSFTCIPRPELEACPVSPDPSAWRRTLRARYFRAIVAAIGVLTYSKSTHVWGVLVLSKCECVCGCVFFCFFAMRCQYKSDWSTGR